MTLENELLDNILREIKSNNIGWKTKPDFNYTENNCEVNDTMTAEIEATVGGLEFYFFLEVTYEGVYTDEHTVSMPNVFYDAELNLGQNKLIGEALLEQTKCRHFRDTFSSHEAIDEDICLSVGKKEKINVLSLFDGMSCGQIALNRVGIEYENYFASEIDKNAIRITQKNYPNTKQIGSVAEVKGEDLPKIDLLFGGSPCQDLSRSKTDGEGLNGERSGLFWEYVRILKEVKPKYFLLENVVMKKEWADIISKELGVEPIEINSNLVSAQNRRRMYWTNIPNIQQPKDRNILLGDIIYDDTYKVFTDERITKTKKITKNYVKWDLSGKQYWSQQDRAYFKDKKICTLPKANPANKLNIVLDYDNDIYRRMHPIEAERCQNVPDSYTSGVSDNKRLEMLGNGWTVDVIAHIFSFLKGEEIFNNFSNDNV